MQLTYRYRIKDKHACRLAVQARAVNFVWNYCNETQQKAARDSRKWLSGYDLWKLVAGATKEGLDLHSHSAMRVCIQYEKSRKQHKKPWLKWRSRRSLGWGVVTMKFKMKRPGLFKFKIALLASALALPAPAIAQSGLRQVPMGFCYDSSVGSAAALTAFTCSSFTGTGSGTTLTASSVSGQIQVGQTLSGTGVTAGTTIVAQLTNTDANGIPGRAGTYQTSLSTTSNSNSLTTAGAPQNATYGVICAYAQAINYRDDGTAPTASVPGGGQGIPAGQCIPYNGTFSNLQFIQQTSGGSVGISFYR